MKEKIMNIVADHLGIDPECLLTENYLVDDLAADSLDVVEIQFAVEDLIGTIIDDDESNDWQTVQDVINSAEKAAASA